MVARLTSASQKPRLCDLPRAEQGEPASSVPDHSWAALLKAVQTISSQLVLDDLLRELMVVFMHHSDADRACLLLARSEDVATASLAAEAKIWVRIYREPDGESVALPSALLEHVRLSRTSVVLEDTSEANPYSADEYFVRHSPKSVLCLPISTQSDLIAVLYLENDRATKAFASERILQLEALASHAAIALQNAFSYEDLRSDNQKRIRVEEAYRTIIENLDYVVFRLDVHGRVLYVSPAVERVVGYQISEITGRGFAEFIYPEDLPIVQANFESTLAGQSVLHEFRIVGRDSQVHWVQSSSRAHYEAGEPRGLAGIFSDISKRKGAEDELFASRQMLRSILDHIPQRVFWKDQNLKYVGCNEPFALDTGYKQPSELVGKDDYETTAAAYADRYRADDREVMETGRAKLQYEEPHIKPDGSEGWLVTNKVPRYDRNGQVIGILGTYEDITARKVAQDALHQSQQLLEAIVNTSTAIITVKDLEGHFLLVNRRFEELFHVSREALVGKTDCDVFSQERADAFRDFDRRVMAAGHVMESEEIVPQDDGLHNYVSIKAPLRDKAGQIFGVCGLSTDITESKRLEQQLREAQKMEAVGRLAGGIAHDFNNLMTVITGYSNLLEAALASDRSLREKVEEIKKAGEQATMLTRQLLAFSRRQILQPTVLNLNEVLGHMANMLRRLVREDIELDILTDPALEAIFCDPGQIEQVIMNLVINARDAMPDGGKLTLGTANVVLDGDDPGKTAGQFVRLTVTDTGLGMDAETKAHMFEPFFTTKDVGKGTGLGLSTVYGIVHQAGGNISVETELGKGTTFRVDIPRVGQQLTSATIADTRSTAEGPIHGTETVLLVEDQNGLRKLLIEILQQHGYTVLPAANGRQALDLARDYQGGIDIIVTDLVMPEMGGRELVEMLPVSRSATKVLYMSGYTDSLGDAGRVHAGGYAFIDKPFHPEALLRKLREVLDAKGARRSA